MKLTTCYSMSNNTQPQPEWMTNQSITKLSSLIIFAASAAASFDEDGSGYQTLDINIGSMTSISGWCNKQL